MKSHNIAVTVLVTHGFIGVLIQQIGLSTKHYSSNAKDPIPHFNSAQ